MPEGVSARGAGLYERACCIAPTISYDGTLVDLPVTVERPIGVALNAVEQPERVRVRVYTTDLTSHRRAVDRLLG